MEKVERLVVCVKDRRRRLQCLRKLLLERQTVTSGELSPRVMRVDLLLTSVEKYDSKNFLRKTDFEISYKSKKAVRVFADELTSSLT